MKNLKSLLLIITIFILSVFLLHKSTNPFFINETTYQFLNDQEVNSHLQHLLQIHYENHKPIRIDGNSDFIDQATKENWLGNGTLLNPFLINSLGINNITEGNLVSISNTDVYFQIINCFISGGSRGIYFYNVENGIIKNNIIINSNSGVVIDDSKNNFILNNSITNTNGTGIRLNHSIDNEIESNSATYNDGSGIYLSQTNATVIRNNTLSKNKNGIHITSSENNLIENNTFVNNAGHGVYQIHSLSTTIVNNSLSTNAGIGIHIDSSSSNRIV
ncbi:MAG: NosD domain-containing protein, partial [Candidatus Hodarchaeota archaeon]